jgi:hypothetical protein
MSNLHQEFTGLTPLLAPFVHDKATLEKNQWNWEVKLFADASHIQGLGVAML